MEKLLEYLDLYKGKIVSTASLSVYDTNQARASGRMYVDQDGFGYVWVPDINIFPDTPEGVEAFEKWYPLPVDVPKDLEDISCLSNVVQRSIKSRIDKISLETRLYVLNKMSFQSLLSELGYRREFAWGPGEDKILHKLCMAARRHTTRILDEINNKS